MRVARILALPADLESLDAAAAAEGFGMIRVLATEWAAGTQRFGAPGEALFAARDGSGALVGIGGITRDPWTAALRMRRFYVVVSARRTGTGRALAAVAIEHARSAGGSLVRLRAPPGAAAFWEACGFTPVQDARATHARVLRP